MTDSISFDVDLRDPFEAAIERVTAALKEEGFGVLTRIDVHTTLREKIGAEFRPYTILGACNPPLAHRALTARPEVGLLLPCNVTVEAAERGSRVRFLDPATMMQFGALGEDPELRAVGEEARERIRRVAESLGG